MAESLNPISLDSLCAAIAQCMGIDVPSEAAPADERLTSYINEKLNGGKLERVIMYNPDAIAQWVYEKYPQLLTEATNNAELALPYRTVMPSVTPVCFGTMYTGAQPEVHGIQRYEKPVIQIDTLFDALIRAGKKPVIIAYGQCSLSKIYLEREMDYFIYDTCYEVNAKAVEAILSDKYDFIVVYNGDYDTAMHRKGPESIEALSALHTNSEIFAMLSRLVRENQFGRNTLMGFAMDHGCHEIDGGCGSHGLDMPEDLNIVHLYQVYPA